MTTRLAAIFASLAVLAGACAPGPAAARLATPAEVYSYSGSDRQQVLEAGAKQEGKLLWYTSLIIQERARPIADAFRAKYPNITVDIVRLDSNELLARTTEEYKAGRNDVDLVEATFTAVTGLKAAGVLAPFKSPVLEGIPTEAKDADGFYAGDRENILVMGYNTKLVSPAPKTFDDLLDPKWKGKMAIQDSNQAVQYIAALLSLKGEDFVRKLAKQDITVYPSSGRAILDLVAAGEVPMSFPVSIAHVQLLQKQGAPVDFVPFERTPTVIGYVGVASKAPHPNATALFVDFFLSEAGQEAMIKTEMGAVRKGSKNPYPDFNRLNVDFLVPPDKYQAEYKKWQALYKELFVKRAP